MTVTKRKFLIVTDASNFGQSIQDYLKNDQATEICCMCSLSQALDHVIKGAYCLLMVDLQLPGIDKAEMVRIFRIAKHVPILALAEVLKADDKITLLQAGVNAFLEKPIDVGVCSAQANALVELYLGSNDEQSKEAPITFGTSMIIAPRYRQVFIEGELLELTRKEFDLLYFFAKHPGQVFSRNQLYEQAWDGLCELGGDETVKAQYQNTSQEVIRVWNKCD